MPFITKSQLTELKNKARSYDEFCTEEKDIQKQLNDVLRRQNRWHEEELSEMYVEYQEQLSAQRAEHRLELVEKDAAIEELEQQASDAKTKYVKEADKAYDAKVAELEKNNKKTEAALAAREATLETAEQDLEAREARLANRIQAVDAAEAEIAATVKKHAEEVAAARRDGDEIGEKRGYANGLADGIREIGKETEKANERAHKLADKAQDALVEAASKDIPTPTVNVLSVPTATADTKNKK